MIKNSLKIKNLKFKIVVVILISFVIILRSTNIAFAGPTSTNFQLLDYGFGAGGVATSSSTNYMFQGILGEVETASLSSTSYILGPGLTYTLEPNTPAAPSVTNPSNYYNKLKVIIDNGGNSTDATFIIQVSTVGDFSSNIYYVQADNTLGLNPVWQTYTSWGSGTGFNIIGLSTGTTYYARVAAKRGTFQQGRYSAVASAATVNPTFTFSIQTTNQSIPPFSVGIGVVNAGQITTSWQSVTTNISTNANSGGIVYLNSQNAGLKSIAAGNYTITSTTGNLAPASEGYGIQGQTITQTSGGPMEIISPYNGTAQNVGIVDTTKRVFADSTAAPVSNGQATFQVKAKASTSTPAATDYADTITVIGTGSF